MPVLPTQGCGLFCDVNKSACTSADRQFGKLRSGIRARLESSSKLPHHLCRRAAESKVAKARHHF